MEIEEQYKKWKNNEISDADFALRFFLFYHNKKYPNKKLQNYLDLNHINAEALDNFVFKKVKSKAIISLKNWILEKWNFNLLDYIPTPYEVLADQAKGVRPVTIKIQKNFKPILNREDCFEFFLHDLEHGHMFFYCSNLKKMQIEFFQKIEIMLKENKWENYLNDKNFKEKFIYLISDMNSHEAHYYNYLKSMLPLNDHTLLDEIFPNHSV